MPPGKNITRRSVNAFGIGTVAAIACQKGIAIAQDNTDLVERLDVENLIRLYQTDEFNILFASEDTESSEDTENSEDTESSETTESSEDSENKEGDKDTKDDSDSSEDSETTEVSESSEESETSESSETTEDSEHAFNMIFDPQIDWANPLNNHDPRMTSQLRDLIGTTEVPTDFYMQHLNILGELRRDRLEAIYKIPVGPLFSVPNKD